MKTRFPSDRRATWRERFVAIARQADLAGTPPATQLELSRPRLRSTTSRAAVRVRFAAICIH